MTRCKQQLPGRSSPSGVGLNVDPLFGNGVCQDNLETGEVIEILSSNPVLP